MIEEINGKLYKCSRCGKEKFFATDANIEYTYLLFKDIFHMCNDCSKKFEALFQEFMGAENEK